MSPSEREIKRLRDVNLLLIKGRWIYASGLIVIGLVSKLTGAFPNVNFPTWLMLIMVGMCYLINVIYWVFFRFGFKNATLLGVRVISFIQLTVDMLFYTLIIFYAGGLTSISFLYYFYNIIAAAFFYSLWGVVGISTIATLLYGGLIIGQYNHIIPFISRYNIAYEYALAFNYSAVATNLVAILLSFYIVGLFGGLIANALRKREEEIVDERDKVRSVITNLSDGLIFINPSGIIEMANAKAEELLGFKAEWILGKKLNDLKGNKFANIIEIFKDQYKKGHKFSPNLKPDSIFKIYAIDILSEDKDSIGFAKIIHDVSREKFVDKMKSEFIMLAGHQLRTPLSAVRAALDLLIRKEFGEVNQKQEGVLKQCFEYNNKLVAIVDDLLEIFSIEEGKYYYNFVKTDAKKLLTEIIEGFKKTAEERGMKIKFNCAKNLPEFKLDPVKIRLVLNSVIENAIVYNNPGGLVSIGCEEKNKNLILTIKDTGIGVPKESHEQIFSKFYRSGNAMSFQTEGNGLSLFVAKNIVEYHEGRIWFESELNKGTTFYIELPPDPLKIRKLKEKND